MHSHKNPRGSAHPKPEPFLFRESEGSPTSIHAQRRLEVIPSRGPFSGCVLIVVSDPIECARIGRTLCRFGHSVSVVCDARDASTILAHSHFHLVLVEIDPPSRAARLAIEQLLPVLTIPFAALSSTPQADWISPTGKLPLLTTLILKPASDEALRDLFQPRSSQPGTSESTG